MSEHIVNFNRYCSECKHFEIEEKNEPCCGCLDNPTNTDSYKPVNFEPKSSQK